MRKKGGDGLRSVRRILPYTRQLVLYALYDILDSENIVYEKESTGHIDADVTVFGNKSGFSITISEESPATVLTVSITSPRDGLSQQGQLHAASYLADRVEQLLENELKLSALLQARGDDPM